MQGGLGLRMAVRRGGRCAGCARQGPAGSGLCCGLHSCRCSLHGKTGNCHPNSDAPRFCLPAPARLPQKALELQPEATRVAHMLAQLQLAAGDANGEGRHSL